MDQKTKNLEAIDLEMNWLTQLIDLRIKIYFQTEKELPTFEDFVPPLIPENSYYHRLLTEHNCTWLDRMILALGIAPFFRPQALDSFFLKNKNLDRGFTEFGGIRGEQHGGFLPTVETAAFLYAGDDLNMREIVRNSLGPHGNLRKTGVIRIGRAPIGESTLASQFYIDEHWLEYLASGGQHIPELSHEFPAKQIHTELTWTDLVLDEDVLERIDEIKAWMKHRSLLLEDWGLSKKLKKGYRCLFYGPPGTGKTLTASLLGNELEMPVFRVDLSLIVSKYIGETEKNLSKVFDLAEFKGWILFFDEADALFGKRVQTSSSNDRHANQEIAYLLQRIEDFDGLVILASNLKSNLDEAFARRFQSMIYFPPPDKQERLLLWKSYFNGKLPVDATIDFQKIAEDFEITGGGIVNVLRFASLRGASRENQTILMQDILEGVRRELRQMGRTIE